MAKKHRKSKGRQPIQRKTKRREVPVWQRSLIVSRDGQNTSQEEAAIWAQPNPDHVSVSANGTRTLRNRAKKNVARTRMGIQGCTPWDQGQRSK